MCADTRQIIDSHVHLTDNQRFSYYWLQDWMTPLQDSHGYEEFITVARPLRIAAAVFVQAHPSIAETDWLAGRAGPADGVVGWVDLHSATLEQDLEDYREQPAIKAVRDQRAEDRDPEWWLEGSTIQGLSAVQAAGFAYDTLMRANQLSVLPSLLGKLPDMTWIVEHAGKPPIQSGDQDIWYPYLREAAKSKRVACKVSGLVVEADHLSWAVDDLKPWVQSVGELFGTERIMWGSDWPVSRLAATYQQTLDSAVEALGVTDQAVLDRFLFLNAKEWYGLDTVRK